MAWLTYMHVAQICLRCYRHENTDVLSDAVILLEDLSNGRNNSECRRLLLDSDVLG